MRYIICILCCLLMLPVTAQDVKELQRQQQELQEQLAETAKMLKQTKKDETATENKLNLLNNDIKTRKKLIRNIQGEINALNGEMGTLRQKRTDLQKQLEACKEDYARLVRETHYADMQQSPLLFLLSADNFQQLVRRIQYMQQFAAYRKEQVKKIESLQTEIDIQNNLLNQRKNDRSTALQSQKREQDKLTRDERKQKDMLKSLKTQEKNLLAKQKEQQKKVDALNKQMDNFATQLVNHFSDLAHNGREITLQIRTWDSGAITLEDENANGVALIDVINAWVEDNTVNGSFNLTSNTESRAKFEQVRIPMLSDKGRAMDARMFANQLRQYLKTQGIDSKVMNKGLGEAVIVIGEK